jgi:hypothetical protein
MLGNIFHLKSMSLIMPQIISSLLFVTLCISVFQSVISFYNVFCHCNVSLDHVCVRTLYNVSRLLVLNYQEDSPSKDPISNFYNRRIQVISIKMITTTASQMTAPNFNNGVSGLFDLNYPSSPAFSSSASETFDNEVTDSGKDELTMHFADIDVVEGTSYPSTLEHLVDVLFMAWPYHQSGEIALLFYLHHNAATLTNVGALIPALNDNIAVMSNLADNTGYYYTRSSTPTNPSPELEAILGHILA